ncbi:zinc ribbon domain-containing protein [Botrimarina sp.]|uniref:FmdB family zinc ribbon protein n=1 Tax=Botrimarina sp. TaxID=2795802 RepID=UPI0032ECE7F1
MPLYEYLCDDCQKDVEVLVRNESQRPACPDCGGERLKKLLSVPAGHSSSSFGASGGGASGDPPVGPCGSACGCFPQ